MAIDYRLLIDGIIILLLALTILYAALLNRRLGRLRGGRSELEAASRGFAEAALRLDSNLKGLKATAEGAGGILQKRIDRASALSQQLGDLIERSQTAVKVAKAPAVKPTLVRAVPTRAGPGLGGPGLGEPGLDDRPGLARAGGGPVSAVAVAPETQTPLVLNEVAEEEEPPVRRAARRQFAMSKPQESRGSGSSSGSDLANLLAALEELR